MRTQPLWIPLLWNHYGWISFLRLASGSQLPKHPTVFISTQTEWQCITTYRAIVEDTFKKGAPSERQRGRPDQWDATRRNATSQQASKRPQIHLSTDSYTALRCRVVTLPVPILLTGTSWLSVAMSRCRNSTRLTGFRVLARQKRQRVTSWHAGYVNLNWADSSLQDFTFID